ncbi:terminal quinol oxidase [Haloferax sulfurifontis ATCC BAA-897]|uniref:Terminal quinol oxidase n=1 Tax=Haloferax sulfurifontis ATCC BAA-897 TaxID=662480 RepID=M0I118_9EURY|nr:terminal quinol oxidase [Haloferax sulfurifontis ATCC BAA-897]
MSVVGALAAGRILGLDAYLEAMEFVRRRPKLKYLLG